MTDQEKQEAERYEKKMLGAIWEVLRHAAAIWRNYPNKRVKHLALYAKKRRTRIKNMRRVVRYMRKGATKE